MVRTSYDFHMDDLLANIGKTKVMTIKSKNISYVNFMYDNSGVEEVTSYKYFRFNLHHKLNWNYSIEK